MRFDDAFIQQIRSSINIVDVVSRYVGLKKQGRNHSGLCPFHQEKTPSFKVNDSLQIFKCFGCGEGGDVIKFTSLIEGLSFGEAVRYLADWAGIPLPHSGPAAEKAEEEKRRFLALMERAAQYFKLSLSSPQGAQAVRYLKRRQIEEETIERFDLGFAAPGNRLLRLLRSEGYSEKDALVCGLLKESDGGQLYDAFRNRVVFPICDLSGRVIAFGGRILGDGVPKYLNSPETPLYSKSRHLYGLDRARDQIRRSGFSILVEGYFDCVVPHQFGFQNTVASLGTSLTEGQVKVLGRYSRNVIVSYDPDEAGLSAAARSVDLFLKEGLRVRVMRLEEGADPDTFLRRHGRDEFAERIKESQPFLDFLLEHFISSRPNAMSPSGKQAVVEQVLPYLARIPNAIERSEHISQVASRLRLDEQLLLSELRKMSRRRHQPGELVPEVSTGVTYAESFLIAVAFDSEWSDRLLRQLEPELFDGLATENIFRKLLELWEPNAEISILYVRDRLENAGDIHVLESSSLLPSSEMITEEAILECIRALRRKQYQSLSLQLQEQILTAVKEGADSNQIDQLILRKEELRRKMELELS